MTYEAWRSRFLEAVDEGLYPGAWLDKRVASGRARVWATDKAAIIAEIKQFPGGVKQVHGLVAAGDLAEIIALIPLAEAWGRERGCRDAQIESRPEWARVLAPFGYEPYQLTLTKAL